MIDPDSTKLLPRRILASLIDLATVFLPALLILKATVISYHNVERNADGSWQPTPSQFQQAKSLSFGNTLVRVQEWGDSIYIFGGFKYWVGLFVILLLAALVFVLLPATLGASPGKRLTGLRVINTDGEPASVGQYITRTIVGLVDFPIFGALGWIVAANDPQTRRIGDRVASTLVVDAREDVQFVDEASWRRHKEALDNPLLSAAPADLDSMVALDDRLGGRPGFSMPDISAPDISAPDIAAPTMTPPDIHMPDISAPAITTPDVAMPDIDMPDITAPAMTTPDIDMPDISAPDIAAPDIAMPDVAAADLHMPDFTTPEMAMPDVSAPVSSQLSVEGPASDWEQPVGTDAPVWDPHITAPEQHGVPPVDLLAQQAEAQARHAAAQQAEAQRAAQQAEAQQAAQQAEAQQPVAIDPVWSAEWSAWLYWDASGERWLRHDEQIDAWVAIS